MPLPRVLGPIWRMSGGRGKSVGQKFVRETPPGRREKSIPKWQASCLLPYCHTYEAIQGRKWAGEFTTGECQQDGDSFWKGAGMKESKKKKKRKEKCQALGKAKLWVEYSLNVQRWKSAKQSDNML